MDLVAHCDWSGAGQFVYTLSLVDVATMGGVACAGLRDKPQENVFHALQRLQAELPFRILGLDGDNGTEFINRVLLEYCTDRGITFTRSRPYLNNDTCHVKHKNWAVVHRLVGYDRLERRTLAALGRSTTTWRATTSTSSTPLSSCSARRGVLSIKMTNQLKTRSKHLHPYRCKVQLEAAQRTPATRAVRSDPNVRHHVSHLLDHDDTTDPLQTRGLGSLQVSVSARLNHHAWDMRQSLPTSGSCWHCRRRAYTCSTRAT
jgi:hypothetical protein